MSKKDRLSGHIINKINHYLDDTFFTSSGFIIDYEDKEVSLIIRYIDSGCYFFKIDARPWLDDPFSIEFSPGSVTVTERADLDNFDDCLVLLEKWVECIGNELNSLSPLNAELEKYRIVLNEKIENLFGNGQIFFVDQEIDYLQKILDEIVCVITKKYDSLVVEENITVKSLIQLRNDLGEFPKKAWLRSAVYRLFVISNNSSCSSNDSKLIESGIEKILNLRKKTF